MGLETECNYALSITFSWDEISARTLPCLMRPKAIPSSSETGAVKGCGRGNLSQERVTNSPGHSDLFQEIL